MTFDGGLQSGYILRLDVWVAQQTRSGTQNGYSAIGWNLYIVKGTGTGRWAQGPHYWSANIAGTTYSGSIPSYDFRNYTTLGLASGQTGWVAHDGNGNLNYYSTASFDDNNTWGNLGNATAAGWAAAGRIGAAPGAPGTPTASNITPTTATISWGAAWRGNSDIYEYALWVTNPAGTDVFAAWIGNTLSRTVTGLNPGTRYTMRTQAHNGDGYGPQSGIGSFTTLPSTGPTITSVTPFPTGSQATVVLAPPANTTPNTYVVEYTNTNTGTVVTTSSTSSTVTVTGLIPGVLYSWRAYVVIGTYTSPWSAVTQVRQPAPSTNPGDYFDGSSAAKTDSTYAWTGTANNSTSTANGRTPLGWSVTPSGGAAVIYRATGSAVPHPGYDFAARILFTQDTTVAGTHAGAGVQSSHVGLATISEGGTYFGSIYINPVNRTQRVAPMIIWYNAGWNEVSRTTGTSVVPTANTWQRYSVTGAAPSGAVYAAMRIIDVAGDGWSPWLSGDQVLLDAAMLTLGSVYAYFDGDTPDTGEYLYSWDGTANNSRSLREPNPDQTPVDPLQDPDCEVVPSPPRPPSVPNDCIIDVGQWRRFWAVIPAESVSDWLVMIPSLEIETHTDAVRQVRIRYYPNPFQYPLTQFDTSEWCSEQIISYIPPETVFRIDGMLQRAYATIDGGAALSADHLLYGTGGIPATWPGLTCGIEYVVSLDIPLPSDAAEIDIRAYLTQRT